MPTYDYRCQDHGVFEQQQRIADRAKAECPLCSVECKQVMISAPRLDVEGMANAGCPGAFETSGNRMEKRHKDAGQDHHYWRDDIATKDAVKKQYEMDSTSAWD